MCLSDEPESIRIASDMIVRVVSLGQHSVHTVDCFAVRIRTELEDFVVIDKRVFVFARPVHERVTLKVFATAAGLRPPLT